MLLIGKRIRVWNEESGIPWQPYAGDKEVRLVDGYFEEV